MEKQEQEMAAEQVVELGGDGSLEMEHEDGTTVCFDWEMVGSEHKPDMDLQMMVPTKWTAFVSLESGWVWDEASQDVRDLTPEELLAWGKAHADELLEFASDEALSRHESWVENR